MGNRLKKNVPVLRFPEFGGDWQLQKLKNILIESNIQASEKLPLYSLTIESGIVPKTERYERSFLVKNEEEAYKVVQPNDFAYNPMNLRFGALARHTESKAVKVSKYYNIFSVNPKANVVFADYLLTKSSSIKFYDSIAMGSLVEKKRVHFSDFLKSKFLFPPIAEQEKIASFLGAVDTRLTQLRRKYELLQIYKRGVMQKVFCRKLGKKKHKKKPELRLKKFVGDWKQVLVGSFIEAQNTIGSEDIPLYSLTIENGITEKTERYERQFLVKNEDEAYKLVRPNDFAYNPMNLRFGAIARHKRHISVKVSKYYDVFSIRSNVNLKFAEYLLRNEDSIQYYDSLASGSLIEKKRLHFSEFKKIFFLIPSLEEQEKIADFLTALDQKIEAIAKQIELTEQFKKGLLQKMFV